MEDKQNKIVSERKHIKINPEIIRELLRSKATILIV